MISDEEVSKKIFDPLEGEMKYERGAYIKLGLAKKKTVEALRTQRIENQIKREKEISIHNDIEKKLEARIEELEAEIKGITHVKDTEKELRRKFEKYLADRDATIDELCKTIKKLPHGFGCEQILDDRVCNCPKAALSKVRGKG